MKIIIPLMMFFVLSSVSATAQVPPPQAPPKESLQKDTAHVLGIEIDGKIVAIVFVSKTGDILPMQQEQCTSTDWCMSLISELGHAGKALVMQFKPQGEEAPQKPPPTQISLTTGMIQHRPLHEIDVQGHQPDTQTMEGCRKAGGVPESVEGHFNTCHMPVRN